jgi:hypothetical protein
MPVNQFSCRDNRSVGRDASSENRRYNKKTRISCFLGKTLGICVVAQIEKGY